MKFIIHMNEDEIVISGDTIEEIQEKAQQELTKRNMTDDDNVWSEEI